MIGAPAAKTSRRVRRENDFSGRGPGQHTLTIRTPALVHGLYFQLFNMTAADIDELEILADEVTLFKESGKYFSDQSLYDLKNDIAVTNFLPVFFQRWRMQGEGQDFVSSINMGSPDPDTGLVIGVLQVRVTVREGADANAHLRTRAAVGPSIRGNGVGGPKTVPRVFRQSYQGIAVDGFTDLVRFTENQRDRTKQILRRVTFGVPPQNIEKLIVKDGEVEVMQIEPALHLIEQKAADRVSLADQFILDFELMYPGGGAIMVAYEQFHVEAYLQAPSGFALPATLSVTSHFLGQLA